MKYILVIALFSITVTVISCSSSKQLVTISDAEKRSFNQTEKDTISIVSDKTEYEITIIEPGFTVWLNSVARPEGYYSQNFLEQRNIILVREWNQRVLLPNQYNPNLYQMQIDYDARTDYGYEVNYKLYNYFVYFQRKYSQRLGPFLPRI